MDFLFASASALPHPLRVVDIWVIDKLLESDGTVELSYKISRYLVKWQSRLKD